MHRLSPITFFKARAQHRVKSITVKKFRYGKTFRFKLKSCIFNLPLSLTVKLRLACHSAGGREVDAGLSGAEAPQRIFILLSRSERINVRDRLINQLFKSMPAHIVGKTSEQFKHLSGINARMGEEPAAICQAAVGDEPTPTFRICLLVGRK